LLRFDSRDVGALEAALSRLGEKRWDRCAEAGASFDYEEYSRRRVQVRRNTNKMPISRKCLEAS
jgi:hypothetical protein